MRIHSLNMILAAAAFSVGGCFSPDSGAMDEANADGDGDIGADDDESGAEEGGDSTGGAEDGSDADGSDDNGGTEDGGTEDGGTDEGSTDDGVQPPVCGDGIVDPPEACDGPVGPGATCNDQCQLECDVGLDDCNADAADGCEVELGSLTDCLACGDSCGADGLCEPEGCLVTQNLGHDVEFDGLGGLDGFLWGFPVEMEADGFLTGFGFIAGGQGGDVQLSLYTDVGGLPSNRWATADPVFGYAAGTHEQPVSPMQPLPAGTYWIMATASNPTRLAIDINGGVVNFPVAGIFRDFGQPHPAVLVDPIQFINFAPNFYVTVLN